MNLVCIVSDSKYDLYASKLIKSVIASNDIDVVHVCLNEDAVAQPSFVIEEELRFHKIEIPHLKGTSEQKRVYSAVCRFAVAKRIIGGQPDNFLPDIYRC